MADVLIKEIGERIFRDLCREVDAFVVVSVRQVERVVGKHGFCPHAAVLAEVAEIDARCAAVFRS